MDNFQVLGPEQFPSRLREIPDRPKQLYIDGTLPPDDFVYLAVVGSRKHTPYGKDACEMLIKGLAGLPVVIVSGLAIGMDSIAHRTALACGLPTIAIPGSGLSDAVLYPRSNLGLARQIREAGGCLISEYEPDFKATLWSFPRRNRIMAGMSHAVLIIEAEQKSGSLITARLAADYNCDVLAVPGSIFSPQSTGPNFFIGLGATPISTVNDLRIALGFEASSTGKIFDANTLSPAQKSLFDLLDTPSPFETLVEQSKKSIPELVGIISELEVLGAIKETPDGYVQNLNS